MPISKKRKKDGKEVGNGKAKRVERLERAGDKESGVTLQDLINTLAYQEYEKQGAYDKKMHGVVFLPGTIVDETQDIEKEN